MNSNAQIGKIEIQQDDIIKMERKNLQTISPTDVQSLRIFIRDGSRGRHKWPPSTPSTIDYRLSKYMLFVANHIEAKAFKHIRKLVNSQTKIIRQSARHSRIILHLPSIWQLLLCICLFVCFFSLSSLLLFYFSFSCLAKLQHEEEEMNNKIVL